MKTIAIVQARMRSQRLPAKVLMPLCGRPMLAHVVERLRKAQCLDGVVVAIPDSASDEPLASFCRDQKYQLFRGNEQDVLGRYHEAARAFKADTIVRITSDCPLIDPALVDAIINAHTHSAANDYTSNVLIRTFPRGVDTEVLSWTCLERLHREAKGKIYREHVTNFIHDHKDYFRIENVARAKGDRSDLRICVDTKEDFVLLQAVLEGLGGEGRLFDSPWGVEEVIAYLDKHPDIARLNAGVAQVTKTIHPHAS